MPFINQFSKYDEGVREAEKLLELLTELRPSFADEPSPGAQELAPIVALIRSFTFDNRPSPSTEGFLCTLLRKSHAEGQIIALDGATTFVGSQRDTAPMCNFPESFPFVQFASWTGQQDGDAWVFDLGSGVIRCLPVTCDYSDLMSARCESYGVFYDIGHFVGFLRCDAELRGWLPKNKS